MPDTLVWVHADRLSPTNEALVAYPHAPAVFVFDDLVLNGYGVSLNRIQFMYECLMEMPVRILRGDPMRVLLEEAGRAGATSIISTWTPAPRFKQIVDQLLSTIEVQVIFPQPFIETDGDLDLKRFSRFWQKVQTQVLTPDGLPQAVPLPGLDLE